jgi:chromosome segregation ATPase
MVTKLEKTLKEALQVVQDRDKIKKEIDSLIIVQEDIKRNTAKEQKKASDKMDEFTSIYDREINGLIDQKDRLEGALNILKNEIKAKKESITNFDKQIDDLKITVNQLNLERNGLQEELEGVKAEGKKLASKFTE